MTSVSFVFSLLSAFLITAYFLHHYANWRKQQVVVTIATFVAWLFSFSMILVLPIDISSTYYRQCLRDRNVSEETTKVADLEADDADCNEPFSYLPNVVLRTFWSVTYWSSQALTWLIFPVIQNYSACGEFTVLKRLRSTILAHILQNATYIVLFCIILIYVLSRTTVHLNGAQLKAIVISAANTWGLVFVVLFLGFGLVELPRSFYVESDLQRTLRRTYFKVAKLNVEKAEAEDDLRTVCDEVSHLVSCVSESNRFYPHVEQIMRTCPNLANSNLSSTRTRDKETSSSAARSVNESTLTERQLVALNSRLIRARNLVSRLHAQFVEAVRKAVRLETIQTNLISRSRDFKESEVCLNSLSDDLPSRQDRVSSRPRSTIPSAQANDVQMMDGEANCSDPLESRLIPSAVRTRFAMLRRRVRWYIECVWRFQVLRFAAVLFAALSCLVVFSECTFFVQRPVLSVFALLLEAASRVHVHGLFFLAHLVSLATLAYLGACIYFTVFKLRIFNYFQLVGSQQSDERSLIFSAALLCRLTPPLCLNFLGLIHLDSHVFNLVSNLEETQFTLIMGHLNLIKFIADGVNLYFPILIIVLCAFTYFRFYARCLNYFGFQQFLESDSDYEAPSSNPVRGDDLTHEMVDEGRDLVRRACRQSISSPFNGDGRQPSTRLTDLSRRDPSRSKGGISSNSNSSTSTGRHNEAFEMEVRRNSAPKSNETRVVEQDNQKQSERPINTMNKSSSSNRFGVNFATTYGYVPVPLDIDSDDEPKRVDDDDLDRMLEERAAKRKFSESGIARKTNTTAVLGNDPFSSTSIFEDV